MKETFAAALRAEIDAIVTRYEALVASRLEGIDRDKESNREALQQALQSVESLRAERDSFAAELLQVREALGRANARIVALEIEAARATETLDSLATLRSFEAQFTVEKRFVAACTEVSGTMLSSALESALERDFTPSPALYSALKQKGLESVLVHAFKERGRTIAQAPLLVRERTGLAALASAASCELLTPDVGTRFSAAAMDKAATSSDPAEEGNVVECLLPGLRRAGTEGSLVFPRVRVATG